MFDSPMLTYAAYKQLELERARAIGGRPGPRPREFSGLWPSEQTHAWASDWSDSKKSDKSEKSEKAFNWAEFLLMMLLGGDFDFDS